MVRHMEVVLWYCSHQTAARRTRPDRFQTPDFTGLYLYLTRWTDVDQRPAGSPAGVQGRTGGEIHNCNLWELW